MSVKQYNQKQFNNFRIYGGHKQVDCESLHCRIFCFYFLLLIFLIIDIRDGNYPSIYPSLFDATSAYSPNTLAILWVPNNFTVPRKAALKRDELKLL